jgi:hypothetical protein
MNLRNEITFGFNDIRCGDFVYAVYQDNLDLVKDMLTKGADCNELDSDGNSALGWSIFRSNIEVTELLLKAGADPNWKSKFGLALGNACERGDYERVKLLLQYQASVELDGKSTALHQAIKFGFIDCAHLLKKAGNPIDTLDSAGNAPIHIAASVLNFEALEFLIHERADLAKLNKDGRSALRLVLDESIARGDSRRMALKLLAKAKAPCVPPPRFRDKMILFWLGKGFLNRCFQFIVAAFSLIGSMVSTVHANPVTTVNGGRLTESRLCYGRFQFVLPKDWGLDSVYTAIYGTEVWVAENGANEWSERLQKIREELARKKKTSDRAALNEIKLTMGLKVATYKESNSDDMIEAMFPAGEKALWLKRDYIPAKLDTALKLLGNIAQNFVAKTNEGFCLNGGSIPMDSLSESVRIGLSHSSNPKIEIDISTLTVVRDKEIDTGLDEVRREPLEQAWEKVLATISKVPAATVEPKSIDVLVEKSVGAETKKSRRQIFLKHSASISTASVGGGIPLAIEYKNLSDQQISFKDPKKVWETQLEIRRNGKQSVNFPFGRLEHRNSDGIESTIVEEAAIIVLPPRAKHSFLYDANRWTSHFPPGLYKIPVHDLSDDAEPIVSNFVDLKAVYDLKSIPSLVALGKRSDVSSDERAFAIQWILALWTENKFSTGSGTADLNSQMKFFDEALAWWSKHKNDEVVRARIKSINQSAGA